MGGLTQPWRLDRDSLFAARKTNGRQRSLFFNSRAALRRACVCDFDRLNGEARFTRFLGKHDALVAAGAASVEAVKADLVGVLERHYGKILRLFNFYCAVSGATGNGAFAMQFNQYMEMLRDLGIMTQQYEQYSASGSSIQSKDRSEGSKEFDDQPDLASAGYGAVAVAVSPPTMTVVAATTTTTTSGVGVGSGGGGGSVGSPTGRSRHGSRDLPALPERIHPKPFSAEDAQTLFTMVNFETVKDTLQSILNEDRALTRHELLEVLVRVASRRFGSKPDRRGAGRRLKERGQLSGDNTVLPRPLSKEKGEGVVSRGEGSGNGNFSPKKQQQQQQQAGGRGGGAFE